MFWGMNKLNIYIVEVPEKKRKWATKYLSRLMRNKDKAIPVQAWADPVGSRGTNVKKSLYRHGQILWAPEEQM